ncbi:MAG: Spo0E family sporulation regulatory protein-aspartic acid phosphatase [Bacillota bacterium]|nr:Spo0E family sporulation regulatory protein-aspartic acid phosphatase [Bacillota bacterium]
MEIIREVLNEISITEGKHEDTDRRLIISQYLDELIVKYMKLNGK